MLKLVVCSFVVLHLFNHVTPSRILAVIPSPAYSHQMFYQQFWRELAIRGHEIVVVTTNPTNEILPNFKEINIEEAHVTARKITKEVMESCMVKMFITNELVVKIISLFEYILRLPQIHELIHNKEEHFDLVIIENFPGPILGFQHRFKCPMIGVTSLDAMDIAHAAMGNAVHSILYPSALLGMDVGSSVLMRTVATIVNNIVNLSPGRNIEDINRITREIFGSDTPSVTELFGRTDMLFVNANPLLNAVRPYSPSTISIAGGIHMKPAKPLPEDIQEYLDNAKEQGAIYFSLGSSIKTTEISIDLLKTITKTLGELPYKVLWKFEDDNIEGKPDNVKLIKWAPQQDILRHKNIKLFVTQGGLQSLEETLYLHVPVVVMPFMADHHSNAERIRNKGVGLVVDKENLSVEDFKNAILDVITNPTYKETITRTATQIQDTPMTALERAVWWTEYVLRHKGAQHLKGPVIPWYQYYYLDVLLVLVVVALVLIGSLFLLLRYCVRKVFIVLNSRIGIHKKQQ